MPSIPDFQLRYEDNRTFDAAFQLLNRKYSERAHLVHSLANVVLLPHMNIPIFGNVATLQNHVGFLRFLVSVGFHILEAPTLIFGSIEIVLQEL